MSLSEYPGVVQKATESFKKIIENWHGVEEFSDSGRFLYTDMTDATNKVIDCGTLLYKETSSGKLRVYRFGTSTEANDTTYVITMTAGDELRFRVGDSVYESKLDGTSLVNLGAITLIDTDAHKITVTNKPIQTTGGRLFIADGAVLPTLIGVTLLSHEVTNADIAVEYFVHGVITKQNITYYSKDATVLAKIKTDLPMIMVKEGN